MNRLFPLRIVSPKESPYWAALSSHCPIIVGTIGPHLAARPESSSLIFKLSWASRADSGPLSKVQDQAEPSIPFLTQYIERETGIGQ